MSWKIYVVSYICDIAFIWNEKVLSRYLVNKTAFWVRRINFCLLFPVVAQRTPTISYISQEQIKDIGETVELRCSIQYAEDYPVLWIKLNRNSVHEQVALSTGTALIIRDSRFAIRHDTASASYLLQVDKIRSKYSWLQILYICIACINWHTWCFRLKIYKRQMLDSISAEYKYLWTIFWMQKWNYKFVDHR